MGSRFWLSLSKRSMVMPSTRHAPALAFNFSHASPSVHSEQTLSIRLNHLFSPTLFRWPSASALSILRVQLCGAATSPLPLIYPLWELARRFLRGSWLLPLNLPAALRSTGITRSFTTMAALTSVRPRLRGFLPGQFSMLPYDTFPAFQPQPSQTTHFSHLCEECMRKRMSLLLLA
jgi:hypothetical protein